MTLILKMNYSLYLRQYYVRIRSVNITTKAASPWSLITNKYSSAVDCDSNYFLYVPALNPMDEASPWKCRPCFKGSSCMNKHTNIIKLDKYGIIAHFGFKAKFGYWRVEWSKMPIFVKESPIFMSHAKHRRLLLVSVLLGHRGASGTVKSLWVK